MGNVRAKSANKTNNEIHAVCTNLTVKNLLYETRNNVLLLWITLDPDSSLLSPTLMSEILKMVKVVKAHTNLNLWNED